MPFGEIAAVAGEAVVEKAGIATTEMGIEKLASEVIEINGEVIQKTDLPLELEIPSDLEDLPAELKVPSDWKDLPAELEVPSDWEDLPLELEAPSELDGLPTEIQPNEIDADVGETQEVHHTSDAGAGEKTDAPEKKGGSYKEVKENSEGETHEVHHMPADSASPLERGDGPAIKMEKEDHRQTASCGNSREAREYRERQQELIEQGKFREALQMDIDDIHDKFGDKYDDAIAEMLEYVDKLEQEGKING